MIVRAVFASLLLVSTSAFAADDEPTPPVKSADTEPVEAKPRDAEPVAAIQGVRYRILLKTGRTIAGVVRARGVFEKPVAPIGYDPAGQDDPEAGVRLWFPAQQDGFIFVGLDQIERLDEVGALSADEGRAISRSRAEARDRAERERVERIRRIEAIERERAGSGTEGEGEEGEAATEGGETGDGGATGSATGGGSDGSESRPAPTPERRVTDAEREAGKLARLLVDFPPKRWTPESPAEIQRRKVVLGLFPSDEERRFLEVFPQWKRAYDAWKAAEGKTD